MRWRPVAATAAGVVGVLGFASGNAAADQHPEAAAGASVEATTTTTAANRPTGREERLARAAELNALAATLPAGDEQETPAVTEPSTLAPSAAQPASTTRAERNTDFAVVPVAAAPAPAVPGLREEAAPEDDGESPRPGRTRGSDRQNSLEPVGTTPGAQAGTPPANDADPVQQPGQTPPVGPASAVAAKSGSSTAAKNDAAPLAPTTGAVNGSQAWWPADVGAAVDHRLAAAWRETPVRGPPPGVASALGNDGRTTIYQVAIVDGPDGREVSIEVSAVQTAEVNNAGVALAHANGPGSARATGDTATTAIYQTSVVVQRGTGTATVEQDARVDNLGFALAATAGSGDAEAVGNASETTVSQTAVVLILGSGDAQVAQSARVTNSGSATAVSTERDSQAAGNRAVTDVNQVAVVVVHDEDLSVSQSSTTHNLGMANATGGNATGNTAGNRVEQLALHN